MKVFFYSIDDEKNVISFNSLASYENDMLVFEDKSYKDTKMYLKIQEDKVVIRRKGSINMNLEFISNEKTKGYFQNEIGLELDFIVDCSNLIINNNRIDISYSMILDKEIISSHKIWIILR